MLRLLCQTSSLQSYLGTQQPKGKTTPSKGNSLLEATTTKTPLSSWTMPILPVVEHIQSNSYVMQQHTTTTSWWREHYEHVDVDNVVAESEDLLQKACSILQQDTVKTAANSNNSTIILNAVSHIRKQQQNNHGNVKQEWIDFMVAAKALLTKLKPQSDKGNSKGIDSTLYTGVLFPGNVILWLNTERLLHLCKLELITSTDHDYVCNHVRRTNTVHYWKKRDYLNHHHLSSILPSSYTSSSPSSPSSSSSSSSSSSVCSASNRGRSMLSLPEPVYDVYDYRNNYKWKHSMGRNYDSDVDISDDVDNCSL